MLNYYNFIKESLSQGEPLFKFPTGKAVHYLHLLEIIKNAGLDPHALHMLKHDRSAGLIDFCMEKLYNTVIFPKLKEIDVDNRGKELYEKFLFGDTVFLLPQKYDPKDDFANDIEKKISFKKRMLDYFIQSNGEDEKKLQQFEDDLDTKIHYGPSEYSWINESLSIIYDNFKDYYIDGNLRVYMPQSWDYDPYIGYDYPHKYRYNEKIEGALFLSELEKWLYDEFGLRDEKLYEFIIYNEYIEGRYWERIWSFGIGEDGKLNKEGMGKYGMKPTPNIMNILDALDYKFGDNIKRDDGLLVFIDYYKKIEPKY